MGKGKTVHSSLASGEDSIDRVIERVENQYWKIEVSEFKCWMLGFTKFVVEWRTIELEPERILIEYTHTMHAKVWWLYLLNWLSKKAFGGFICKGYWRM